MAKVSTSTRWYKAPRKAAHTEVFAHLKAIDRQQREMRQSWVWDLERYSGGNVTGLGRSTASSYYFAVEVGDHVDVRFNLSAAVVDTAHSLISQAPVIPQYLTTDGDFKLARKAEKASQVLQGQMNAEVREVLKEGQLDAIKLGTGFVFESFDILTGLPGVVRVSPFEVYVEHLDGLYRKPRSMHRKRPIPREVLEAAYPRFESDIATCAGVTKTPHSDIALQGLVGSASLNDFVDVVESWHLRPGEDKKGRHTICIGNATLVDEDYDRDTFPCSVFRYRERDLGFYGAGLLEAVRTNQSRVDKLIKRIDKAQDLGSNLVIFNPNGEGSINPDHITNDLGLILNYTPANGPPTLAKWEGTLDDLQRQVEIEMERALSQEGISPSQTNGQGAGKGLDSGVAVRAADDVQSRRLVAYVARYQSAALGAARLFANMNDHMSKKKPSYTPVAEGSGLRRNFLRTSRWKDVRPPDGDARLSMASMSALPTTPQGRWAAVQEWVQAGFCSRVWAQSLLDFPDLDQFASLELAHMNLAKFQIEQLLDGEVPELDPRQDLAMLVDLATKSKFQAWTMGADQDVRVAFEDFIVEAEGLLAQAQPPAPPPAAPAPAPMAPMAPGVDPMTGLPMQAVAPGLV